MRIGFPLLSKQPIANNFALNNILKIQAFLFRITHRCYFQVQEFMVNMRVT